MNLERNVGRNDKNIRIAIGILLMVIGLFKGFWLLLIGAIVTATGVFSFCGLYKLLGINTASTVGQQTASTDLSERATANLEDFKEEALETAQEAKTKATELASDLKDDAEEALQTAKKKLDEVKNKHS